VQPGLLIVVAACATAPVVCISGHVQAVGPSPCLRTASRSLPSAALRRPSPPEANTILLAALFRSPVVTQPLKALRTLLGRCMPALFGLRCSPSARLTLGVSCGGSCLPAGLARHCAGSAGCVSLQSRFIAEDALGPPFVDQACPLGPCVHIAGVCPTSSVPGRTLWCSTGLALACGVGSPSVRAGRRDYWCFSPRLLRRRANSSG